MRVLSRAFSAASAEPSPRTVWVKKEGDPDFVKLTCRAADVNDLKAAIITNFPILQGKDPSTITLHLASDKAGKDVDPVALDGEASVEEALSMVKGTIGMVARVVDVADSGASEDAGEYFWSQPRFLIYMVGWNCAPLC